MSDIIPDDDVLEGGKDGRISRRLAHAIDLLLSGKCSTQAAAAEQAGLTRSHFNRALKKPHIRAFIARRTSENFVGLVPMAAATVARIMSGPNAVAALNAALVVLKQFKVVDTEKGASVAISLESPGYIINLRGDPEGSRTIDARAQPLIDVTPAQDGSDADGADE